MPSRDVKARFIVRFFDGDKRKEDELRAALVGKEAVRRDEKRRVIKRLRVTEEKKRLTEEEAAEIGDTRGRRR